jgi:hypothetical protein
MHSRRRNELLGKLEDQLVLLLAFRGSLCTVLVHLHVFAQQVWHRLGRASASPDPRASLSYRAVVAHCVLHKKFNDSTSRFGADKIAQELTWEERFRVAWAGLLASCGSRCRAPVIVTYPSF